MRDYMSLSSSPVEEDCAQLGSEGYRERAKAELHRYKEMMEKRFPDLPVGMQFVVKAFPHDFGTYYELCVIYDNDSEEQNEAACFVEGNMPMKWSEKEVLRWADHVQEKR